MGETVCLVTGGAGFIGCALSAGLAKRFDRIVAIDNLHPQVHAHAARPPSLHNKVELIVGDICDPALWDVVLNTTTPQEIIHLAAETGTGQSLTHASRHAHTNVVGTTQMLDALSRNHIMPQRIVLSSSRAVYGEGMWEKAEDRTLFYPGQRSKAQLELGQWDFLGATALPHEAEKVQPRPCNIYAATKLAQEHILQSWAHSFGIGINILRLQNVYGPLQSLNNPYTGIVSLFCRQALAGETIQLYEDGQMTRDFVFIDDVVSAFLATLDNASVFNVLDIGSGRVSSMASLGQLAASINGAPAPVICGKYRHGDVRHASCNVETTQRVLKWKPAWDIQSGLEVLCKWISMGQPQ